MTQTKFLYWNYSSWKQTPNYPLLSRARFLLLGDAFQKTFSIDYFIMKKIFSFDLQKNSYSNPQIKEIAQILFLKKIESKQLLRLAEQAQSCYQISEIRQVSECFKQYKSDLKRIGDALETSEKEIMNIDEQFQVKETNCYSLVSEFEMESCLKEYKLQSIGMKQKVLDRINELI